MVDSLNPKLRKRLDAHRIDFERVTGRPFRHFFCPILAIDEPAELIRGHVINQAFDDAARDWVVQRGDVDSFYGAYFESGFELLQYRDRLTSVDMLTDKVLGKKFRPVILRNGVPVAFTGQPFPPPDQFACVEVGEGPDAPSIGLRMSRQELIDSAHEQWEVVMFKDARIAALVSLIKAAHLTLFHLLGYRYATSAAGLFVGRDILGRFYRSSVGRSKKAIHADAWSYFREFQSVFRPVVLKNIGYKGTLSDRKLLLCHSTSGQIWAMIVLVKTGEQMHAVMIPAFDSADSVPTFLDFLKNDNERIQVTTGEFDPQNQRWTGYADRIENIWPKHGLLYPESPHTPVIPPMNL